MKKVLILLVTMMLCACSPAEPMSLKDSYGQYKQEKIVYANKKDYMKKKDAYNVYLVYEIDKDACTFESDLKYQNIQYKKVELSKDEKEKVPEALIKYNLYEGEKQLGIAVYCKSQYKNVGLGQYKNVGFPTFLYCLFSLHLL